MGIEEKMFDYKEWDGDVGYMSFYDCILKQDIGTHKTGEHLSLIELDWITGELYLYSGVEEDEIDKFNLELKLV